MRVVIFLIVLVLMLPSLSSARTANDPKLRHVDSEGVIHIKPEKCKTTLVVRKRVVKIQPSGTIGRSDAIERAVRISNTVTPIQK